MRVILTHFYNEEYLLPWWLNHHKKYFDFGILIDYGSTDRSVEICRSICPHWQIVPSRFEFFDAENCDQEIMFYERQFSGWRIALTTTEFLVGDISEHMTITDQRVQHIIPGIRFTGWNPAGSLDINQPLWHQITTGIDYRQNSLAHQGRSLHNFNDIQYSIGRHYWPCTTERAMIFHYAHCLIGLPMIQRRLQIQHKVSARDKDRGLGNHHYINHQGMDLQGLEHMHKSWIAQGETDCSDLINKLAL